jgi:ribosomal protein S18 acetylase RimI-like enzyme
MLIRQFEAKDQIPVKVLIQAGLREYFYFIDETLNPDLDDITLSFNDGCFLVGEIDGQLVATGGYKPYDNKTLKMERVSVHSKFRRHGLASQLFTALISEAKKASYKRVVLETTSDWQGAIDFWLRNGFRITHVDDSGEWSETWFEREI